jgi:hypothetical protein
MHHQCWRQRWQSEQQKQNDQTSGNRTSITWTNMISNLCWLRTFCWPVALALPGHQTQGIQQGHQIEFQHRKRSQQWGVWAWQVHQVGSSPW